MEEEQHKQRDKQLELTIEILKKSQKQRSSIEIHQLIKFMSSYHPLQSYKTKMGFSIFRVFSQKMCYNVFPGSTTLWKNPKYWFDGEERSLEKRTKYSKIFNVILTGKVKIYSIKNPFQTFHNLEDESNLAYVGEFQGNISERRLMRLGVKEILKVVSCGPCECMCLLQADSDVFFPVSKRFKLSLSDKFNFIKKVPLFQDVEEGNLIKLAMNLKCRESKIRSQIYSKGDPVDSLYIMYKGNVELSVSVGNKATGIKPKTFIIENQIFGDMEIRRKMRKRVAHADVITEKCQILVIDLTILEEFFPDYLKILKKQRREIKKLKREHNLDFNSSFDNGDPDDKKRNKSSERGDNTASRVMANFFDRREKLKFPKDVLKLDRDELLERMVSRSPDKSHNSSMMSVPMNKEISPKRGIKKKTEDNIYLNSSSSALDKSSSLFLDDSVVTNQDNSIVVNNTLQEKQKQLRKLAMIKSISKTNQIYKKNLNQYFKLDRGTVFKKNKKKQPKSIFTRISNLTDEEKLEMMKHRKKSNVGIKSKLVFKSPNKVGNGRGKVSDEVFFDFRDFLNPSDIKKIERKHKRENIKYAMNKRVRRAIYEMKQGKKRPRERKDSILLKLDYLTSMKKKSILNRSNGFKIAQKAKSFVGSQTTLERSKLVQNKVKGSVFTFDGYGEQQDYNVDPTTFNIVKRFLKMEGENDKVENLKSITRNKSVVSCKEASKTKIPRNRSHYLRKAGKSVSSQGEDFKSKLIKLRNSEHASNHPSNGTKRRRYSINQSRSYLPGLKLNKLKPKPRQKSLSGYKKDIQKGFNVLDFKHVKKDYFQNPQKFSIYEYNKPFLAGQVFELFNMRDLDSNT